MYIAKKLMTQNILKEYFNYDPFTGFVTWKTKHCSKIIKDSRAGSIATTHKHRVIKFMGCVYAEHRLIWLWYYGVNPQNHIDHINHDEHDNRLCNLREVTPAENNLNNSKRKDNTTGVTGVYINSKNSKKKYTAELHINGKRMFYQSFYTFDEAVTARKEQEIIYGFHANHGITKPL